MTSAIPHHFQMIKIAKNLRPSISLHDNPTKTCLRQCESVKHTSRYQSKKTHFSMFHTILSFGHHNPIFLCIHSFLFQETENYITTLQVLFLRPRIHWPVIDTGLLRQFPLMCNIGRALENWYTLQRGWGKKRWLKSLDFFLSGGKLAEWSIVT